MNEAVIVSSVRTACGRAGRGSLANVRPEHIAASALKGALDRCPGLEPSDVEDVILGCAMPEGEQGVNIARVAALKAGLPVEVPAMTVNRMCASGLQTIVLAAEGIMTGAIDVALAGGVESMSMVPMMGSKFAPDPDLAREWPDVYLSMGLTAENLTAKYGITREDQDAFAYQSHMKAIAAQDGGKFAEEIVPIPIRQVTVKNGNRVETTTSFEVDEGPRRDTTLEALARLRPAFNPKGTITAGNASQRSDGAAAAVVMSRKRAESLGLNPLAVFRGYAVAGVPPEIMGIGPLKAIPKVLEKTGLSLDDIEVIELNEAFAVQALSVIREAGLDPDKINLNGGAVALGHPLGCTGAKLTATLLHEMQRRGSRYGMVTMCIGGGMGAAGIFERV
ncbi:acetyl-CoA acetyltransferase [candidate division BRC1 bacterium SM23_51]|nr:MAG: acetyl-CoA acetyltransferase [candidate division BRC1 bacterium SM23_51]